MTTPALAHATTFGRMYSRTPGGTPEVPSITTVMDQENQRMEWWTGLCSAREAVKHGPRLAEIEAMPDGRERRQAVKKAVDWIKDVAQRDMDAQAEKGTRMHSYGEARGCRDLPEDHPMHMSDADVKTARELCIAHDEEAYAQSFDQFWDEWKLTPLHPEMTVWNHTHQYAGTTDLVAALPDGRTLLIDYKSKRKTRDPRNGYVKHPTVRPFTAMQLCAAARAEEIHVPDESGRWDWQPMPYSIDLAVGVAVGPDGYVVCQYDIWNPVVWDAFRAYRTAWDWYRVENDLMSRPISGPNALLTPQFGPEDSLTRSTS